MAGIAGAVYKDIFHVHLFLEEMLFSLSHRCLKTRSQDLYTHKNVRLGIIGGAVYTDLKKNLAVILDGEIYNQDELTKELSEKGLFPASSSELIADCFLAFGEEAFGKLDGDFAFALHDRNNKHLYLVRDRVGVKPLYWFSGRTPLLFASELKALLTSGVVPLNTADDALAAYFSLGYIPQDMTPIQGVSKLLPGHFLRYSFEKGITIHPYWSYSTLLLNTKKRESKHLSEELVEELNRSVKSRLITPKSGCYLSGGIGSASVARSMASLLPYEEIPAFTVGYKGQYQDDVLAAKEFSKGLHLNQTVGMVTPENLLNSFAKIVWLLDEPLADPGVIGTWNLTELAKAETRHLFSGMGSDELLAGHLRYSPSEQKPSLWYWGHRTRRELVEWLFPLLRKLSPRSSFSFLKGSTVSLEMLGYLDQATLFSEEELNASCPLLKDRFNAAFFLHKFHRLPEIHSPVKGFLYLDFKTRLPDLYIAQYERLNSAQGIDWRAPYLSMNLIRFVASIPDSAQGANLLRSSLYKQFPKEIVNRPKKTRKDLLLPWIQEANLIPYFRALRNGSLVESGILSPDWIENETETAEQVAKQFPKLWALFTLEVWFKLFMKLPVSNAPPTESLKEMFDV